MCYLLLFFCLDLGAANPDLLRDAKPIVTLPQLSSALWYPNTQRPAYLPYKGFVGLGLIVW
jgi:hypothetical protein